MHNPEFSEYEKNPFDTNLDRIEIALPDSDEDFTPYWCEMFNWVYGRGHYRTTVEAYEIGRERIFPTHLSSSLQKKFQSIKLTPDHDEPAYVQGLIQRISPMSDTEVTYKFIPHLVLTEVDLLSRSGDPISQHPRQEFLVPLIYEDSLILESIKQEK